MNRMSQLQKLIRVAVTVVATFAAATPRALHAQCQSIDTTRHATPFRVKWNVGNLLVTPDSTHGVSFWFATNQSAQADGHNVVRQFDDQFVPDSLLSWLIYTRQLLELTAPLPNDTSTAVKSGYLRGLDGGLVVAARIRKGKKLSDRTRVLMLPKQDSAFMIELDRSSMDTLIKAAAIAADRSGYRVPAPRDTQPSRPSTSVSMRTTNRAPRYPHSLQEQGIEGEVWTRYCVDVDGTADLSTVSVALSDHEKFEQAVKAYLREARFVPATINGTPIPEVVAQRFVFALGR